MICGTVNLIIPQLNDSFCKRSWVLPQLFEIVIMSADEYIEKLYILLIGLSMSLPPKKWKCFSFALDNYPKNVAPNRDRFFQYYIILFSKNYGSNLNGDAQCL